MGRRPKGQMARLAVLREIANELHPSQFLDLGSYLARIYRESKLRLVQYSYREFSLDLGLGLGNSSWLIIHGKRLPNAQSIERMATALHLAPQERKAMGLLARYSEESDPHERELLLSELLACNRQSLSDVDAQIELDFYREWHHAIIFEMVGLQNFSSDPAWIAEHLNAAISEKEVKESLEILEKLACIRYDSELGRHVKVVKDFESKSEVPGIGIIRFHQRMIDLGKEAIISVPYQEREIGAVTLAVTNEGMDLIKKSIQSFRSYLMFLASQHATDADTVMQLNMQMFPIAQSTDKKHKLGQNS